MDLRASSFCVELQSLRVQSLAECTRRLANLGCVRFGTVAQGATLAPFFGVLGPFSYRVANPKKFKTSPYPKP